eukprot:TRINITY_DN19260_c0_g1_i1.p1 TRINITY_DN19260_c0_g1~~TRINITY_DN19260_c0_g1_i1.p1  ORF type:complete len:572 (-),score=125.71 TRINITY_DN19260_c0_g1_i1:14-1525(-)
MASAHGEKATVPGATYGTGTVAPQHAMHQPALPQRQQPLKQPEPQQNTERQKEPQQPQLQQRHAQRQQPQASHDSQASQPSQKHEQRQQSHPSKHEQQPGQLKSQPLQEQEQRQHPQSSHEHRKQRPQSQLQQNAQKQAAPISSDPLAAKEAAERRKSINKPAKAFAVGDVVQYWSDTKGKWIDTRIKALHLGPDGAIQAYDCSGKPKADIAKVRARPTSQSAKAKASNRPAAQQASKRSLAAKASATQLKNGSRSSAAAGAKTAFLGKVKASKQAALAKRAGASNTFAVGERVAYWSENQGKWLNTRIKAVNYDPSGAIASYNCSGKPQAEPAKLRRRTSAPAPAAAEAVPAESSGSGPLPQEHGKVPAMFEVGQKVRYCSEQAGRFVKAVVVKVMRTKSGRRLYDLSIKKGVPESKLRAVTATPSAPEEAAGSGLIFKNDLKRKAQGPDEDKAAERRKRLEKWRQHQNAVKSNTPPGPPGPPPAPHGLGLVEEPHGHPSPA